MANKFTLPEYHELKNSYFCVVAFKEGKHNYTYAGLSIKEATERIVEEQGKGHTCLLFPSSNTHDVKGLEVREYKEEEQTIEYYLQCLKQKKGKCGRCGKELEDEFQTLCDECDDELTTQEETYN